MPRLVHSRPKYRRHRASGQAVVTIQGKDHYLGPWQSPTSKAKYDRLVAEWLVANRHRSSTQPEYDLTVTELVAAYWDYVQGYYVKHGSPTRTQATIKASLRFLRQHYGDTQAVDFGPRCLKALREKMVGEGWSRPYVNSNVARIKAMFKWAVSEEMLPASVYQALAAVLGLKKGKTGAREPKPVGPVPDEALDATIPFLPPVVADMVRFQRLVGCRPGEVCVLRPGDVDRSRDVWCYVPESHKTEHHGRERRIFIGPKAQTLLLPYLLRDASAYCFSPRESRARRFARMRAERETPVQPSQVDRSKRNPQRAPGDRYTKDSYRYAVRRAVDRANTRRRREAEAAGATWEAIPHWHPNQLRHTAATVIRREFGLEAAQVALGHSRADVTQIYAERDFSLAQAVMAKIG